MNAWLVWVVRDWPMIWSLVAAAAVLTLAGLVLLLWPRR